MRITNRGWWVLFVTSIVVGLMLGFVLPARGLY